MDGDRHNYSIKTRDIIRAKITPAYRLLSEFKRIFKVESTEL